MSRDSGCIYILANHWAQTTGQCILRFFLGMQAAIQKWTDKLNSAAFNKWLIEYDLFGLLGLVIVIQNI